MKKIKITLASLRDEANSTFDAIEASYGSIANVEILKLNIDPNITWAEIEVQLGDVNCVFLAPALRLSLGAKAPASSINSHFIAYADFLENRNGRWWARTIFPEVVHKLLISVLKIRDFRGPVIFLGESPLVLPVLQTLARFNFSQIFFLNTNSHGLLTSDAFLEATKSLVNLNISMVDSTAFIQSQREYALCFIAEAEYPQDVIEDMSYFHFLSSRSTVFDISGGSNFQYDEVKALGVHLTESSAIFAAELAAIKAQVDRVLGPPAKEL